MARNQVVRFGLSDSGPLPVEAINITQTKFNLKKVHGSNDLDTGFAVPSNQVPYPMGSSSVSGICHDYSGNLYIVDPLANTVYKIEEGNRLTIVAGSPTKVAGNLSNVTIKDENLINRAIFSSPNGICCDKSGNIYVADTGNHCIKVISGGKVYLVAGSTVGFEDNADGKLAKFNQPWDVTVDRSGNIFVADMMNHAIRKIYKGGSVMTVAGSGHAGNANNVKASRNTATFDQPVGVCTDNTGNVYVIDGVNNFIKKITPNGWVYRFSGSGISGHSLAIGTTEPAYKCQYEHLTGMDIDASGNLYVVDMGLLATHSRLLKIDQMGRPSVIVDYSLVDEDYYITDVTCSPAQKLFVTVGSIEWREEGSSSSSSSSSKDSSSSSSSKDSSSSSSSSSKDSSSSSSSNSSSSSSSSSNSSSSSSSSSMDSSSSSSLLG